MKGDLVGIFIYDVDSGGGTTMMMGIQEVATELDHDSDCRRTKEQLIRSETIDQSETVNPAADGREDKSSRMGCRIDADVPYEARPGRFEFGVIVEVHSALRE